jgi:glycosyltransferase involved in cell wall biosynthesis
VRIALFSDTFPDDVNGVARTLGMLVEHASRRGHEFSLITPQVSDGNAEHVAHHTQLFGIKNPIYPNLQLARGLNRRAKRKLAEFRPDLVHIATESTIGYSGRIWTRRNQTPLVTSYHTNFPAYLHDYGMGPIEPLLWRYLRWFHGGALVTFCPSNATLEDIRAHGFHDRLRIWSRGVDTELFDPARRSEEVRRRIAPGADTIMVYVGRLATEKRADLLMEVYPKVRDAIGPGTALVYVGDGPIGEDLRAKAPEGVHFTGFLRGVALAEAYAAADIFLFPSDTETFGNVVLEGLASGLPAVVSEMGGVTETAIPDRTGILCRPGDADSYAEACIRLLSNPMERRRLAEGARAEALSRSWEAILDGVICEYEAAAACDRGELSLSDLVGTATAGDSAAARGMMPFAPGYASAD